MWRCSCFIDPGKNLTEIQTSCCLSTHVKGGILSSCHVTPLPQCFLFKRTLPVLAFHNKSLLCSFSSELLLIRNWQDYSEVTSSWPQDYIHPRSLWTQPNTWAPPPTQKPHTQCTVTAAVSSSSSSSPVLRSWATLHSSDVFLYSSIFIIIIWT